MDKNKTTNTENETEKAPKLIKCTMCGRMFEPADMRVDVCPKCMVELAD